MNSAHESLYTKSQCKCGNCTRPPGALKHLLVAVDDSEQSRAAAQMAARLARALHAEVTLLNVFTATCASTPEIGFIEPDVRASCIAAGGRFLDELKAMMPNAWQVETVLREGDPATEIVRAAKIYDADLIIMGTHARGRLARAVLGSVADAVTQTATCPVLTVAHSPVRNHAATASASDISIGKILQI